MTDVQEMFRRQAIWQRSRQSLTWPEKIRMAEMVRESVKQLCASAAPRANLENSTRQKPKDLVD
jgi:hypothetical protein